MQPGVQLVGQKVEFTPEDEYAIKVGNMLSNGMGGYDMSGLEIWCAYYGITDIDGLLLRLEVINGYEPPKSDAPPRT